jgi:signal transduction histidine kinase
VGAATRLDGTRTFLFDAAHRAIGKAPEAAPDYLGQLAGRPDAGVARLKTDGGTNGTEAIVSWAPVPFGGELIIEQNAALFDVSPYQKPSNWGTLAIAGCFGVAILVVAAFDVRRRRALARADVDRASFLAIVGHELRTPLTVLKGFIDTLSARWDNLEDGQRHSLVEPLSPQVRRLNRAVERLLVAADIQRGAQRRPSKEPVAVLGSLEEVAGNFRPLAPLHTFEVEAPPDLVATADRKAFAQVLDQLVDNAVKYSPAGGTIALRATRSRGRVEIIVEDEGVGLPSDFGRIFDAFSQGEEVDRRTHDEGGVGVGLFIARTLVDGMGGKIRAERRAPEPGTRLSVTLPAGAQTDDEHLVTQAPVHGPS